MKCAEHPESKVLSNLPKLFDELEVNEDQVAEIFQDKLWELITVAEKAKVLRSHIQEGNRAGDDAIRIMYSSESETEGQIMSQLLKNSTRSDAKSADLRLTTVHDQLALRIVWICIAVSLLAALVGLVLFRGAAFGFALFLSGSLMAYEGLTVIRRKYVRGKSK